MEIWKKWDDFYDISSCGRIRSWKNARHGKRKNPRIIKSFLHKDGYLRFVQQNEYVHKMVSKRFLDDNGTKTVNHLDGNKTNNFLYNLELISIQENIEHAINMGLMNNACKIQVFVNGKDYNFNSIRKAEKYFGITYGSLARWMRGVENWPNSNSKKYAHLIGIKVFKS